MSTALDRFKLESGTAGQKRTSEGIPAKTKQLKEVIDFKSPGIFFVEAKIANLQYKIYNACPLKQRGLFCRRKLNDEMYCETCEHSAKSPLKNLFLRMEFKDCADPECTQYATMFAHSAEKYLQLKAVEIAEMSEKEPEKLANALEAKLEKQVVAKLTIKESKGDFENRDFDWIITSIFTDSNNKDHENAAEATNKTAEKEDGEESDDEDGQEIQLVGEVKPTNSEAFKKAKKN
ncbi:hypothetical protein niasHT_011780 [Heterodera trifolii]|uniref:Replication factor A C-terminal domain-containing protein n=1 Tax=Heterodera trifolii TaxID=157864 RepID=A0ABD2L543_9BILA